MKNASFFLLTLWALLACEGFAQNIDKNNDMPGNHENTDFEVSPPRFGSSFRGDNSKLDKYGFSLLSDDAKLIVFNQLLALDFYPERKFLRKLEDIREYINDPNKQSRRETGEDIKLYREGYLTGLVIQMKKFEEYENSEIFTNNTVSSIISAGDISLLDSYNMEMFSPRSPYLVEGFFRGRDQISDLVSGTIREIENLTFEYLKKRKTLDKDHLSEADMKQILSKSPHYEAVVFLRKVIEEKMKVDKKALDDMLVRLRQDKSVEKEEDDVKPNH